MGFTINAVLNSSLIKVSDNHIIYLAKFGSAKYRQEDFDLDRIDLISPSSHMVG